MKNTRKYLEDVLLRRIKQNSIVSLACNFEEADSTAKSIIEVLRKKNVAVSLTCFWNKLILPFDNEQLKTAIVTRKYQEITPSKVDHLILVDSINLDECITKTNLFNLLANFTVNKLNKLLLLVPKIQLRIL
jgi:hypothetical protein